MKSQQIFSVLWVLFYVCCLHIQCQPVDNSNLLQVNLLYRHGDRSPSVIFPTDPHQVDVWPDGLGWLSNIGKNQLYALGKWIRRRYDGFLNSSYIHSEILVTSSDEERCLMSAECNLAGLYPPTQQQLWNVNLPWQPIPIHTRPKYEDKKLKMGVPCPAYEKLYDEDLHSPALMALQRNNQDLFDFLNNVTGWTNINFDNVWKISDAILCEKAHNLTVAPWVDKPVKDSHNNLTAIERIRQIEEFEYKYLSTGRNNRFHGGPLLKEYIANMQKRINGTKLPKMYMHSGHGTTVEALLATLGLYSDQKIPPYAAMVSVELRQKTDGQYYVNVYYKNTTDTAYLLPVKGCVADCPWEDFIRLTKDVIPIDWDRECGNDKNTPSAVNMESQQMFFVLWVSVFVFFNQVHSLTVDNSNLLQVNLVYRHGDRSPIVLYPTDPNTVDKWPDGLGWLSTIGINQHYELGKWIRRRYDGFLNSSYIHSEILVTSSDEERCLMSAESNLAGLYPPTQQQLWNVDLLWQPIPVHSKPLNEDRKIAMEDHCAAYTKLLSEDFKSPDFMAEQVKNKDLYDFLNNVTGWTNVNRTSIMILGDTLLCEFLNVPPWVDKPLENSNNTMTVYERIRHLHNLISKYRYNGKKNRFYGGPLLKEYIENMQKRINGTTLPKMYMYSGHGTTVGALLTTLGLFSGEKSVPYAAMVGVELRQKIGGQYYVNVYYKNTTDTAYPLAINGCVADCPWEDFIRLTKDVIPTDWDQECGNNKKAPSAE